MFEEKKIGKQHIFAVAYNSFEKKFLAAAQDSLSSVTSCLWLRLARMYFYRPIQRLINPVTYI